ncbi:MAG: hypothetical protein ABL967_18805 [Bryobacteraceae bacterium]
MKRYLTQIVAVILLILGAAETVFCDTVSHYATQSSASSSSTTQGDEECGCSDGCICCCRHALPVTLPVPEAVEAAAPISEVVLPSMPVAEPLGIYHPPRF